MTLRELLNEILSLTVFDAGLVVSGTIFVGLSVWEWITIDPVDEERFLGQALLRERARAALYPLGYLVLGLALLIYACA